MPRPLRRAPEDIVEDALAGYLQEAAEARTVIERRYDDLKDGRARVCLRCSTGLSGDEHHNKIEG